MRVPRGPAGEIVCEDGAAAEVRRPEIEAALAEALARHRTAEGVMLATSSWMVSARYPR